MTATPKFRHELKYICSGAELKNLEIRLKAVMRPDPHAKDGRYLVRSIYFDDYDNTRILANADGTSPREKWRIRAYNADDSFISLECKRKEQGMIRKTSCVLSKDQYHALVQGTGKISADNDPLLNRFLYEQLTTLLRPAVIVQYLRVPLVYPVGNVRVTFDLNIASSDNIEGFFDEELAARPVLQTGMQLLEVKYDELIPDHIYHAVQMTNMQWMTFSKYCLCRQFNMQGMTAL